MARWVFILTLWLAVGARADESLNVFTNQAEAALRAQMGLSLTNIPIYCPTNASVRYSAALHYILQAAANSYDITTPATNYPSIFRPRFGSAGGDLFIIGYTNVTGDADTLWASGWKDITDPSIGVDDNVWGVPWVVGAKGYAPQFNHYSFATVMAMTRILSVYRPSIKPLSHPTHTNQFYEFMVSNIFGLDLAGGSSAYAKPVTVLASNRISIALTNNYNWGTNITEVVGTENLITHGPQNGSSYLVITLPSLISFPLSEWIENQAEFTPVVDPSFFDDTNQIGLPEHQWTLTVTNDVLYGLMDGSSGTNRLLDFVNVAGLGAALNWSQTLNRDEINPSLSLDLVWQTNGANDAFDSPASDGVKNQILIGAGLITVPDWTPPPQNASFFQRLLLGDAVPTNIMQSPFSAIALLTQTSDWPAKNPKVHYTTEDLTNYYSPTIQFALPRVWLPPRLPNLGQNYGQQVRTLPISSGIGLSTNGFEWDFAGVPGFAIYDLGFNEFDGLESDCDCGASRARAVPLHELNDAVGGAFLSGHHAVTGPSSGSPRGRGAGRGTNSSIWRQSSEKSLLTSPLRQSVMRPTAEGYLLVTVRKLNLGW
jgi:hypothetical protein